ncbi:MAG: glycosyltransferase family 2 protein [Lentisphaeria bacterium]|nr:glycosyltransferase family 2 protein [Lentisphaeria bacterium]
MYKQNLLSICCLCYNHEQYIEECINSIWANKYKNIEIIVIDDGSTDNSVEILKKLQKKSLCNFKLITQKNTHNIGLNCNRAAAEASGEFITFMATDDYYTPDAFSEKLQMMQNNSNIVFAISRSVGKLENKKNKTNLSYVQDTRFDSNTPIDKICKLEYYEGTVAIQGNIIRHDLFDKIHGYDEDIYGDDIIIRTKIFQHIQKNQNLSIYTTDTVSFIYRIHPNSYTSEKTSILKIFLDTYDRYWSTKPYPPIVEKIIYNYILSHSYIDVLSILSTYPRVFDLLQHKYIAVKCLHSCLNKSLQKKNLLFYIIHKEPINITKSKIILFNTISISIKEKYAQD